MAAVSKLRDAGTIAGHERVLCFNTGAGIKYPEAIPAEFPVLTIHTPDELDAFFSQLEDRKSTRLNSSH